MAAAKRRRRSPRPGRFPRLVLSLLLGAALALCLAGFVHFTAVALYRQRHFAPSAEHPSDWYAEGCLALALVVLAAFLLSRPEPPPTPWRRIPTAAAWRQARPARRTRRPASRV